MKVRTLLFSGAGVALAGLALLPGEADAIPPPPGQAVALALDPFFVQRETMAPAAIKATLAQERQRVQAAHLNYLVGYTTAMDRPAAALRGGAVHPDGPQRMAAQAPKAEAWAQATQVRLTALQAQPQWPRPHSTRADFRPFLKGDFTHFPQLSQFDPPTTKATSVLPPIKNQANCGSCFAFGPTTALEWSRLIGQSLLGFPSVVVSPQSVLSCAHAGYSLPNFGWPTSDAMDECTNGGFAEDVAAWLTTHGAQRESDYPYVDADVCCPSWQPQSKCTKEQNENGYCPDVPACKSDYKGEIKATGWNYLNNSQPALGAPSVPSTADVKQWISKYGPLVVSVNAAGWNAYAGGVFSSPSYYPTDHIVVLIGWDDTVSAAPGQSGAWIVQNSWGTGWGETCGYGDTKGYMYLAFGSASVGGLTLWLSAL
jgi:C1A family cysteine protease